MKTKRFGHTQHFAIDVSVFGQQGKYVYAELKWWVGGNILGDHLAYSDVCASARFGRTWLQTASSRPEVAKGGSPSELFYHYVGFTFDLGPNAQDYWNWPSNELQLRRRADLTDIGVESIMDSFVVISLRGHSFDWIIAKGIESEIVIDAQIPKGETERVVREFCDWVEGNYCKVFDTSRWS
jgi:hypothetical protein